MDLRRIESSVYLTVVGLIISISLLLYLTNGTGVFAKASDGNVFDSKGGSTETFEIKTKSAAVKVQAMDALTSDDGSLKFDPKAPNRNRSTWVTFLDYTKDPKDIVGLVHVPDDVLPGQYLFGVLVTLKDGTTIEKHYTVNVGSDHSRSTNISLSSVEFKDGMLNTIFFNGGTFTEKPEVSIRITDMSQNLISEFKAGSKTVYEHSSVLFSNKLSLDKGKYAATITVKSSGKVFDFTQQFQVQ